MATRKMRSTTAKALRDLTGAVSEVGERRMDVVSLALDCECMSYSSDFVTAAGLAWRENLRTQS
jgi:hypothetical protein